MIGWVKKNRTVKRIKRGEKSKNHLKCVKPCATAGTPPPCFISSFSLCAPHIRKRGYKTDYAFNKKKINIYKY